ncbi:MAG: UDP-2,3-diacylglucosamine diphosphatase [Prolixibacteraceae bacterium]|nr:UDP-2,3-diacylglucosamine diphosphatase [Prolixibacteraceae bacterium]MBN2775429.1 UDP-2,3-diacylglucosamine diphosphatase [Prolixibacteraceae bacterium]
MKKKPRKVDLVVLSDIHLGTYGCHASELYKYLKSIQPGKLILNGDIIDIWQFSKRYWPNSHMKVVKQIMNLASKGTQVFYITGNHDETLRKFEGQQIGNFQILNKLVLNIEGQKAWFFHGDIFDVFMKHSRWLAKLGAVSYDALILLNIFINKIRKLFGYSYVSVSKKIKDNVKSAVKYINNFEETAAELAVKKGYDYIICGHIHKPENRILKTKNGGNVRYLNSGDWIENLSALEYRKKKWKIYSFFKDKNLNNSDPDTEDDKTQVLVDLDSKMLFKKMIDDFQS